MSKDEKKVAVAEPQAVAKPPPKTIKDWLNEDNFKAAVADSLPKHVSPERFIRMCISCVTRIPKLQECTPATVLKCFMDLSALGLEPDGRRAHLIPFENKKAQTVECQLIIDYKGFVELAMRSGNVSNIHADVICENDEFEYDRGIVTKHKIDFRKSRGEMYAVWSRCVMKDGTEKYEVLSKDEVEGIKARSFVEVDSAFAGTTRPDRAR
jgi:recombination protein RecT